jgi:ABC-type sugar transport system ATPase subunit
MDEQIKKRQIYQTVTFYVRPEHIKIHEAFVKEANKDERLKKVRKLKNSSLMSIAIIQLEIRYLREIRDKIRASQSPVGENNTQNVN